MEQLIDDAYSFYNYSFKFWAFIPWFMLFSWTLIDIPLALLSFVYPSLAQLAFLGFLLGWLVGFWPQIMSAVVPWIYMYQGDGVSKQIYYSVALANNNGGQMNEQLLSQISIAYGDELAGYQYTGDEATYTGLSKLSRSFFIQALWVIHAFFGTTIGGLVWYAAGSTYINLIASFFTVSGESAGGASSSALVLLINGVGISGCFLWALINQIFVSYLNNSMEETFEAFVEMWPYETISPTDWKITVDQELKRI